MFSTQKYGVPLFPLLELTTQRDYDGKIVAASVYVPLNMEEMPPYKALLNGFALEMIGTQTDVMALCKNQLPHFKLPQQTVDALSRLRGASKGPIQTVPITCSFTSNRVVNPYFMLDFKVKGLRMN